MGLEPRPLVDRRKLESTRSWADGRVRAAHDRSRDIAHPCGDGGGVAPEPVRRAGSLGERAAREALKAQVPRLERELSAIVAGGFPHLHRDAALGARRVRRCRGCSHWPSSSCRDRLATRVRQAQGETRERDVSRAPRARSAGADAGAAGALQVRASARRRARRTRLRRVGGAPATRPDRDARRLVAAEALLRLSVSHGAARDARLPPAYLTSRQRRLRPLTWPRPTASRRACGAGARS